MNEDTLNELVGLGYKVERTGKMVPGDGGELIEQIVVTPPYFTPKYMSRPQPKSGTIYFVGPKDGPIKIGFANRLEFRLRDLQLANALPLIVHATVEGPPKLEREYHRQFAAYRLHGEWFEPHPDILAEVERLNHPDRKGT